MCNLRYRSSSNVLWGFREWKILTNINKISILPFYFCVYSCTDDTEKDLSTSWYCQNDVDRSQKMVGFISEEIGMMLKGWKFLLVDKLLEYFLVNTGKELISCNYPSKDYNKAIEKFTASILKNISIFLQIYISIWI